ncbi:MAG: alternative ribosome rescue aminoacyl-tRNA hydrolase ArfB [Gemmatimonadota bacterium]
MDSPPDLIELGPGVRVAPAELAFRATRSGGPGGQHVNTSATRVELSWDIAESPSLSEELRGRLLEKLGNRLHGEGVLRVVSARTRSQLRNRDAALERMRELVGGALQERRKRRPTRPSRAARERRLAEKKKRAARKKDRRPVRGDE